VIRLNRDTLYSFAVVDLSEGATLSMPDPGTRYVSAMVVNQDHYVNRVIHEPGDHHLTVDEFDTPYVVLAVRTLADPRDECDLVSAVPITQGWNYLVRLYRPRPEILDGTWIFPTLTT